MAIVAPIDNAACYFRAEDKRLKFIIYAPGSTARTRDNNSADRQNISGWSISFRVSIELDEDAEVLVEKTTAAAEIEITDAEDGECVVFLTDDDIEIIEASTRHYYELKRMDEGFKTVLRQGPFSLRPTLHGANVDS